MIDGEGRAVPAIAASTPALLPLPTYRVGVRTTAEKGKPKEWLWGERPPSGAYCFITRVYNTCKIPSQVQVCFHPPFSSGTRNRNLGPVHHHRHVPKTDVHDGGYAQHDRL